MQPTILKVKTLEEIVLGKCKSFVSMGVWPAGQKLKPNKWLENFTEGEREHALYLLNSFTYYNLDMSVAMLKGAILNLSKHLAQSNSMSDHISNWKEFLKNSVFVPAVGESPNITDSAVYLAGELRRFLLIPEEKIITVDKLYQSAYSGILNSNKRVIFFDDFIGSGQQFLTMWQNDFERDTSLLPSVRMQCATLKLTPHYCGMIGTRYGINNINMAAPEVDLSFSHVLPVSASPLDENSMTWPKHLKRSGPEFILEVSRRAGIPEDNLRGFHNLGLALAFAFTIPDATLPIFHWDNGIWSPLMIRS